MNGYTVCIVAIIKIFALNLFAAGEFTAFIDRGDSQGDTALHIATEKGHLETVKFLVNSDANKNAQNSNRCSPLHAAVMASSNASGKTAKELLNIVQYLVDEKANQNIQTRWEKTPLHLACEYGREEMVKILIRNKEGLDAKDFEGNTPLHFAIEYKWMNIVKLLVDAGANMFEENNEKKSALDKAVLLNWIEGVKYFIAEKKVSINVQNSHGFGLLNRAIFVKNVDMVRCLIELGADPNKESKLGLTPLAYAEESEKTVFESRKADLQEIVKILKQPQVLKK